MITEPGRTQDAKKQQSGVLDATGRQGEEGRLWMKCLACCSVSLQFSSASIKLSGSQHREEITRKNVDCSEVR